MSPSIYIIAGPNGVAKTTFAREFLPNYANCRNFINADLIAQGMAPFSPETAAFRAGNSCSPKLIIWHSAEPILVLKRRSPAEAT
jgi:predicted ABC-type ATPase